LKNKSIDAKLIYISQSKLAQGGSAVFFFCKHSSSRCCHFKCCEV